MSDFKRTDLEERKLAEFKPRVRPAIPEPQHIEEEEEEEISSFSKFKFLIPIIVLAIISFVSYAWYTDKFAISHDAADLPVVKANTNPLREKPEDPGGMKIINRDKRVYDAISGKDDDKDKKAENILPAPEDPIAHDDVAKITGDAKPGTSPELINKLPEENTSSATTDKKDIAVDSKVETVAVANAPVQDTAPSSANTNPAAPVATTPPVSGNAATDDTKTIKAVTAKDIKDVAPSKKATVEPTKAKGTISGYRVQLGSYRSEGDAEISWTNMKKKFPTIIGSLGNYIEKANLGDKGIYYRLQISGIASESDARKICQSLTSQKQECFFVGK